jgi:hypothetical protein
LDDVKFNEPPAARVSRNVTEASGKRLLMIETVRGLTVSLQLVHYSGSLTQLAEAKASFAFPPHAFC